MEERHLIVTIYERDKLLQSLKEWGFLWIEGEGILDRVLIALAPNSERVEGYLQGLVGSNLECICFISLSPNKEIAEKKRDLLDKLGYGNSAFMSFYSVKQEEKVLARLLQSAKDSSDTVVFVDDNPYRILKFQDNQANYKVVRHPYTVGRYPSHVYVASANYYK